MPALTTLTAAGVPGRRRAFAPKTPSEPGGGRPSLGRRLTRLSAAGVPDLWRARPARTASWDAQLSGALPRLASTLVAGNGGYLLYEIRLDFEFAPTIGPNWSTDVGGSLPRLGGGFTGTAAQFIDVTLAGSLPKLSSTLATTFFTSADAALDAALPRLASTLAGTADGHVAAFGGDLPKLGGSVAGVHTTLHSGPLLATLAPLSGTVGATFISASIDHALVGALPRLGGAITATFDVPTRTATLDGSFAPLSGVFREASPAVLITRVLLAGRIIDP